MPLRDHFRSPVNDHHTWDALHALWPGMMVQRLFDILPAGYVAAPGIHLGQAFEVDVTAYETEQPEAYASGGASDGLATAVRPEPTMILEADLTDQDAYEVFVYDAERGRQLVAAIEIVSPSNKDRPVSRRAFLGKTAALLQKEVCVSIVDLVTIRHFNLFGELLELLGLPVQHLGPAPESIYAVTIRPRKRSGQRALLDLWYHPLLVGQPLPALPIWLDLDLSISLPLEESYEDSCRLLRIA